MLVSRLSPPFTAAGSSADLLILPVVANSQGPGAVLLLKAGT